MKRMCLSLVALALLNAGCQQPPPPVPGALPASTSAVLVTVNDDPITQDMLDAQLKQLPDDIRAQLEKVGGTSRVKDNLVAQELLYQEALKRKMQDDPGMKVSIALAERQALAQAVLNKTAEERMTDQVLQQWYQDHQVQFAKPQVQVSHISVADKAKADDIVKKAKGGADFADLAKQFSQDKSAAQDGGKIGWLGQKDVREPLTTQLFAAQKGDVVGPIANPKGFDIFKIDDRRDQVPFEEVKDQIKTQAQRDVIQKYIDELEKGAKIEQKDASGNTVPSTDASKGAAPGGMPMMAPPKLGAKMSGMSGGGAGMPSMGGTSGAPPVAPSPASAPKSGG